MERQKRKHGQATLPGLTEEPAFAAELGVAYDTYRKWRKQQKGAAYVRIGRKFYVTDPAKTAYIKSLEVQPVRSRR